jgi:hypothetical protein
MGFAMTTNLNNSEKTSRWGHASHRSNSRGLVVLQVEHCSIDNDDEPQGKENAMDKTLADSFPASDPPAWQPRVT